MYKAKLERFWPDLQALKIVEQEQDVLTNSDFFKYSPYKALTEEQAAVIKKLLRNITAEKGTHIVNGGPGTGKSIVALNLLKRLREDEKTLHLKVALVVPMEGLRKTYQKVVKRISKLGPQSVIGPNEAAKQHYDILIVDEAHRLRRRVNLGLAFGAYDKTTAALGLPKEATQLDWIRASSTQQVLFYDKRQSVVPGDIRPEEIERLQAKHYGLVSQMRVEGGEDYLKYVDDLLALKPVGERSFPNYELKFFSHVGEMFDEIRKKNTKYSLARMVAGYAWPWSTKKGKADHDMEIDGVKLTWNSTNIDWIYSPNSINEVGCIHTVQGYDLNYAGIIIGPELSYDEESNSLVVNEDKYEDANGKRSISHPDELKYYIINIYKTLLTRGIKGTYVYVVDEKLRNKLQELIGASSEGEQITYTKPILSPITVDMLRVPVVGSAPCGNPLFGEENIEEYILVDKSKIKTGFKYFILKAEGDSMNLAGINDGDLVLCRQQLKADTGDRVVALLGDNVTIKYYDKRDGRRILLPKSTNRSHMPITPEEGDSVQGVVQEVLVRNDLKS
ncbi:MAG: hypothetical protein COV96_02065 [Candidatus Zambryskibacteria bacterium CG11_big_fil_rev_8_21_14_0_20_42_18]|nr:MAG: hypothetical protein COV96_02065 [Candidatus Zambryskibacteria bacterium CG11_big_fil_rev_8_21_14_0_20_42_18]